VFATINTAVQTKKKTTDNFVDRDEALLELKEEKTKESKKEKSNTETSIDFEFGNTAIVEEIGQEDGKNEEEKLNEQESNTENEEGTADSEVSTEETETVTTEKAPSEDKEVAKGTRQIEMAKPELDGGEEKVISEHNAQIQSNSETIKSSSDKAQLKMT